MKTSNLSLRIVTISDNQYAHLGLAKLLNCSESSLFQASSLHFTNKMLIKVSISEVLNHLSQKYKVLIFVDNLYFNLVYSECSEYRDRISPLSVSTKKITSLVRSILLEGKYPDKPYSMTTRELDIICEILKGRTVTDIAFECKRSVKTISALKRKAQLKMKAKSLSDVINRLYWRP